MKKKYHVWIHIEEEHEGESSDVGEPDKLKTFDNLDDAVNFTVCLESLFPGSSQTGKEIDVDELLSDLEIE